MGRRLLAASLAALRRLVAARCAALRLRRRVVGRLRRAVVVRLVVGRLRRRLVFFLPNRLANLSADLRLRLAMRSSVLFVRLLFDPDVFRIV